MLSAIGVLALKIEDKQQEITLLRDEIDERRRIAREEGKDSDQ